MGARSRSSKAQEKKGARVPNPFEILGLDEQNAAHAEAIADLAARELYQRAHLDPSKPHGAPAIAVAILGDVCIQPIKRAAIGADGIVGCGNSWLINVAERVKAQRLNHVVAHELAEWWLEQRGYRGHDRELLATRIAARVCVADAALAAALRELGEDIAQLSRCFVVSQSLMSLRIAEWSGRPTALLTSKRILVRGRAWHWPTTREGWLDLLQHSEAFGLKLTRLTDARDRWMLHVLEHPSR